MPTPCDPSRHSPQNLTGFFREELKQSDNLAFVIHPDRFGGRNSGQTRHRHDISSDDHDKFGAHGQSHFTNGDGKPGRGTLESRVSGKTVLGFGCSRFSQAPSDGLEPFLEF